MALTPCSIGMWCDATDSSQTLTLAAADTSTTTLATIKDAFYGVTPAGKPIPVTGISDNGLSITFIMLPGIQALEINIISPNPIHELLDLWQGTFLVAEFQTRAHTGSCTVLLNGLTPAPAPAPANV